MIAGMRGLILLALVLAACGGGGSGVDAVPCGAAELACDGTCIDPMTDPAHCGSCENACTGEQECRAGMCQVPCRVMLNAAVRDAWGTDWDGVERSAATVADATATCGGIGARLPSVTELYRARTGPDGIGTAADTNPLWSSTPNGRADQITVQLSDGAVAAAPEVDAVAYRCVCAADPSYFGDGRCHGPPSSPCFTIGRLHVDNRDRPALRKSAAIWECAAEHAHLADPATLVEALQQGLLGSNAFLHTADQSRYDLSTTMRWSVASWVGNGNVSYADATTPAPFRCAGWSFATGTHPATIAGEFVGPRGGYKGESADTAATTWAEAHDACTVRGGHLARSAELGELIMAGLPSGTDTNLWSADEVGYDGNQFLASVLRWSAVDVRYPYEYTGSGVVTWAYKTGSLPFRCIYYPIDAAYQAPATCNGGCFVVTLPGPTPGVMWFDSVDRGTTLWETAIDACRREGGHLPSERDFAEAIRAGLPNGTSPSWLMTSDLAMTNNHVVRWTGVEPAYTDQYSTYMSWAGPTTAYSYRCMWTNELR
jgi:hypothetical protein